MKNEGLSENIRSIFTTPTKINSEEKNTSCEKDGNITTLQDDNTTTQQETNNATRVDENAESRQRKKTAIPKEKNSNRRASKHGIHDFEPVNFLMRKEFHDQIRIEAIKGRKKPYEILDECISLFFAKNK